ncbi:membrane-bound ClpP family serine protease [Peribacillus deserti]|uniref:Membrane-bound ClpP family serine protease n=1 Tax=Peribacillus deserti TaxID=673318 RepID=A0ABS2QL88_9BACI|nr:membrane-bound ClpP family serine protease [Peribacillus deserti]
MEVFGVPIESIYLYTLIISGAITLLYLFFGDLAHGAAEALDWFNPILLLSFITFVSASGCILEYVTSLNSYLILGTAAIISFFITTFLNIFILIPLSRAEESLVYTEDSLNGRMGKVILTIPENGYGEVVLESYSGMIAKSAKSYDQSVIREGSQILVIDIEHGVLLVKEYEPLF